LAGAHACACVKAEEVSLTVSNIAMLGDRSPVSRYIYRSVVTPKAVICCILSVPSTAGGGTSICWLHLGLTKTISQYLHDFWRLSLRLCLSGFHHMIAYSI